MAETAPENAVPPSVDADSRSPSMMRKLLPGLIVVTVVGVECAAAYLFLPSPSQTAALAHVQPAETPEPPKHAPEEDHSKQKKGGHGHAKEAGGEKEEKKHGEAKEHKGPRPDLQEVDLGQFTVTSVQAGSNTTLRIAFHLYGIVSGLDQERFEVRMKETQHRFREQVILAIRAADLSDLTEPGLGLIKRTILEKSNAMLGLPLLKAIVVSDFSFMEV